MATNTRILTSDETLIQRHPHRYGVNEESRLVTFIKEEPPTNFGKGRKRNPIITEIYNAIITNRDVWAHINIKITSAKQKASIVMSLYSRARKDNLFLSTRSMYNESTKTYDLWVKVSS